MIIIIIIINIITMIIITIILFESEPVSNWLGPVLILYFICFVIIIIIIILLFTPRVVHNTFRTYEFRYKNFFSLCLFQARDNPSRE